MFRTCKREPCSSKRYIKIQVYAKDVQNAKDAKDVRVMQNGVRQNKRCTKDICAKSDVRVPAR